MAISYVGAATGASATSGTITPALPTGLVVDDMLVMVGENANQAQTISNSAGGTWTQITGSPQGTGTAGGTTATGCQVWLSRYNGTQTAPTISNVGDHRSARIYAFRGVSTSVLVNASTGGVEATSDTSLSAPGVTTTVADCWVVHAATLMDDGQDFGATWTNANLTSITVRNASFGHTGGNDGRLILVDGVKASAGASGNTTNTLTAASVKAFVTFALEPAPTGGAATVTPVVFDLVPVTVTATPQPVNTTISPVAVILAAVELTGSGGPATISLSPVAFRTDPVAVTPTPQPVTTTATSPVARLEAVPVVVPLRESFDKTDGTPLGPDRTWTRRVFLPTTQWQVASNRARLEVTAAAEVHDLDLQVPSPNIDGVGNQQATLAVTAVTQPAVAGYAFGPILLLRFALYNSDTNFRAYSVGLAWNDTAGAGSDALWLVVGRFDALDEFTPLWVDGVGVGDVTLPGTLTARVDGDQISGKFVHAGTNPTSRDLAGAFTDNTYSDGGVALLGNVDLNAGASAAVSVDDLFAYTAPVEPATVNLRTIPPTIISAGHRLRFSTVAVIFTDGINALDSPTPPTDIYDGGDSATPNADLNDPEIGLATATIPTFRFDPVPVGPVGTGEAQTPITAPAVVFAAVAVTATPQQATTSLTPAVVRIVVGVVTGPIVEVDAPGTLQLVAIESSLSLRAVGSSLTLVAVED